MKTNSRQSISRNQNRRFRLKWTEKDWKWKIGNWNDTSSAG